MPAADHLSDLHIELCPTAALSPSDQQEVLRLCSEAYEEDFAPYLEVIGPGIHLFGRIEGALVSHLMWVPRTLEVDAKLSLRTAYIEAVATRPSFQGRGFASALLRRAPAELADFDLAALSPSNAAFYQRLGWQLCQGPLHIRTSAGLEPTPGEEVMILRLPKTPPDLPLDAPLSAEWRPGEVW